MSKFITALCRKILRHGCHGSGGSSSSGDCHVVTTEDGCHELLPY